MSKENQQDTISANNQMISENLIKIHDKLTKIKLSFGDEEENEYENFYNRINFYFSNIVTELKLSFVEQLKMYQNRENELKIKLHKTEEKVISFDTEKLKQQEESNKFKSSMNEKVKKLEEDLKKKNEVIEKNNITIKNLSSKCEKYDQDVIELVMDKIILQAELENSNNNEDSKLVDITQYIEYPGLINDPSPKKTENKKEYKEKERSISQYNLTTHKNPLQTQSNILVINKNKTSLSNSISKCEKSRNIITRDSNMFGNKTECPEGRVNLMESYQKSKSKDRNNPPVNQKESKVNFKVHLHNQEFIKNHNNVILKNYSTFNNNLTQTPQHNTTIYENESVLVTQTREDKANNSQSNIYLNTDVNQSSQKSNSLIMNYRKTAYSIKDLKMNLSNEQNYSHPAIKNTHSANHKSSGTISNVNLNKNKVDSNLPLQSKAPKNNIQIVNNYYNDKEFCPENSNIKPVPVNAKNSYLKNNSLNNASVVGNINCINSINSITINKIKSLKDNAKLDKNLINSSVEFEKYKSTLMDKLNTNINFKKNTNLINKVNPNNSQGNTNATAGVAFKPHNLFKFK